LQHANCWEDIEALRNDWKNSPQTVSGADYGTGSLVAAGTAGKKVSAIARYGISTVNTCKLLCSLATIMKVKNCVELGTSLGLTTAYLSRALPKGHIWTFEGNLDLCRLARQNWNHLGCQNITMVPGAIDDNLGNVQKLVKKIDFAIVDANHTQAAMLRYYTKLRPLMSENSLIFFDDIRWSRAMYAGWKKACAQRDVPLSIELLKGGILVFAPGLIKQHYVLSL
jgi:predicted O-methyltransferase YrrM